MKEAILGGRTFLSHHAKNRRQESRGEGSLRSWRQESRRSRTATGKSPLLPRSHGFTLLEVLVAVSILGLGVAVTMQTFSGGLKNVRRIDLAHRAMGHAENIMNRLISDEDLMGPIQLEGDLDDEFDYAAIVDFWEPPQPGLALEVAVPPVNLLLVEVRVRYKNDSRGKFYTARCLKLVPDPYAAPVNRRGSQSEMERILRGGR